jgi:hypothetical protein
MVKHLPVIETRFDRVIIMPSSFDVSLPSVRSVLASTKALVFARETHSFDGICQLYDAKLAYDCALVLTRSSPTSRGNTRSDASPPRGLAFTTE